jgi:hypothetical protein
MVGFLCTGFQICDEAIIPTLYLPFNCIYYGFGLFNCELEGRRQALEVEPSAPEFYYYQQVTNHEIESPHHQILQANPSAPSAPELNDQNQKRKQKKRIKKSSSSENTISNKTKEEEVVGIDDPDEFTCPITLDIMTDPVMCSDGHTYERSAIIEWLAGGNSTSPVTNKPLPDQNLVANHKLRQAVERWLVQRGAAQRATKT